MPEGFIPSAALLKAVLIHNAYDLYPGQFGLGGKKEFLTTRPNMSEGFGRADVGAVVSSPYYFLDEKEGLSTGQEKKYAQGLSAISRGQKIKVTLVYTDAPGLVSAKKALVNDLDLSVMDSRGQIFYPNHLDKPDSVNNVEMVEFVSSPGETYTIIVKGTNVPVGKGSKGQQPYALVWNYQ
jgi:hypothetical protein